MNFHFARKSNKDIQQEKGCSNIYELQPQETLHQKIREVGGRYKVSVAVIYMQQAVHISLYVINTILRWFVNLTGSQ